MPLLGDTVMCIQYHTWWPSSSDPYYQANIPENTARTNYYQPGSKYVPRAFIDGIIDGQFQYNTWGNLIRERALIDGPLNIRLEGDYTTPPNGTVSVLAEAVDSISFTDLRLFVVITEDGIFWPAPNGVQIHEQTMRDMIPGATGDPVTLVSPGDFVERDYDFTIGGSWEDDSCNVVVFVQDYLTKEILHSTTSRITALAMQVNDVGPTALLNPGDSVFCDSLYSVQARVENFGEATETFNVNCRIDSSGVLLLDSTKTVTDLGPGLTEDVTFSTGWHVSLRDAMDYGITIATLLAGDDSTYNDTLVDTTTSRCLWIEDVAPVLIVWPGDTVYCSSSSDPAAKVTNLGQIEEDFDVVFSIDTNGVNIYEDTVTVTSVDPAETTDVVFNTWTVPDADGITYDLSVWTMLTADIDTSNDTLHDGTWGRCFAWEDVYPSRVVWPGDTVLCDSSDTVRVKVVNAGGLNETFDVVIQIDTNMVVIFDDTASVIDLLPSDSTDVVFDVWTVLDVDSTTYGITTWTLLASDSARDNDTLVTSTFGYCWFRDVGVLSRVSPPDTVLCEQIYAVTAWVMNYGHRAENFDVICAIDSNGVAVYDDTTTVVDLAAGDSVAAGLNDWTVLDADSTSYNVTFHTELVEDFNAGNDTLSELVFGYCPPIHDCGIDSILGPPDTVEVDSVYTPSVFAHNWGDYTETFDVICTIDGYEDTAQVVDLLPGSSREVAFDPWWVSLPGSYLMSVVTEVLDDANPENDSASRMIEAVTGVYDRHILSKIPAESGLLQNAPNPLSIYTHISYQVAASGKASLNVYDLAGRLVKVLFRGHVGPGYYSARWEGDDEMGNPVSSGVYIYKLRLSKFEVSKKLVVVR